MNNEPNGAHGNAQSEPCGAQNERNNGIEYELVGDYYLPLIALKPISAEEKTTLLGRYARMRRVFLKEHRPIEYSRLLLSEQLFSHLREVDAIADERRRNGCPDAIIVREIVCE